MADSSLTSTAADTDIPETFIEQVKDALENLYDFVALQRNPLAQSPAPDAANGAHRLRRKLIDAIETLNPGGDVVAHSGAARIYNLVYLHYVGGMTLQEAALEVGLSLRQAYRDLRRGQERVSAVLWFSDEAKPSPQAAAPDILHTEITRLESISANITVPIRTMLESAVRAVQRLAEGRSIALDVQHPSANVTLTTNPAIAQQVLTHLLSQVIQQIAPPSIRLRVEQNNDSLSIRLSYPTAQIQQPRIEPIIAQMLTQIRWRLEHHSADGEEHLTIDASQQGPLLLLVDDNEGLVDLLNHYLSGAYRLVAAQNGDDGLRMARQLQPDAILLDLMMPGMDGWELLQRLRTSGDTQLIPVIICSVISDPELAYSLGASKCVPKPVTKDALLAALHELHI